MLSRQLSQASAWRSSSVCLFCAVGRRIQSPPCRPFSVGTILLKNSPPSKRRKRPAVRRTPSNAKPPKSKASRSVRAQAPGKDDVDDIERVEDHDVGNMKGPEGKKTRPRRDQEADQESEVNEDDSGADAGAVPMTLEEALLGPKKERKKKKKNKAEDGEPLDVQTLYPDHLEFTPVKVEIPPVPMLSYGLDRVLFNPGVYRLQDSRSRVYNFDPYLEKIMPVNEFDFDALSEYKTSSKDTELLAITQKEGTKFTGSTSSMSSVLQHFHYLLSNFRSLNHSMMSREFPDPSSKFSKVTLGPSAVFLRYKDGVYAIDADKSFDSPNIMSWLGHSLEKLLTTSREDFERYRKSSPTPPPAEDDSSRCYHYSRQGNLLMRSQLDAFDPRLPGTGIFDLKTRAVVSIRMNHHEYVEGQGYQLRHARGEWESFEREFYDMTRATLLKYTLQVRMGRMDGIFVAYHNIERIFGFQYFSLPDLDAVIHGQSDIHLGNSEFKLSIALLDELLTRATTTYPDTTLRLHFETRPGKVPFMYVFAEPVTEEQADEIQSAGEADQKRFAQTVVGVGKNDPKVQEAWQGFRDHVDEQIEDDQQASEARNVEEETRPPPEDEVAAEVEEEKSEVAADEPSPNQATSNKASADEAATDDSSPPRSEAPEAASPKGPLMGWILTSRSKVNGVYVDRPMSLDSDNEWKIEYHIQEIPEKTCWNLYNALKERRRKLIGQDKEEIDKHLKHYRETIQRYTERGRDWRQKQDDMNQSMGVQLYKPLGPGSGESIGARSENTATATERAAKQESEEAKAETVENLPPVPS